MTETPFVGVREKGRPVATLAIFAFLILIALFLAGQLSGLGYPSPLEPSRHWLGWLLVASDVGMVALYLHGRRKDPTIFRLDHQGAFVPSHNEAVIPWSAVVGVHEWQTQHLRCLVLQLDDPEQYPAKGFMSRLPLEEETGGTVAIPVSMTDRSIDEVAAAIDYFRRWNTR